MIDLMVYCGLKRKRKIPRFASPPSLNTPKSMKKVGDEKVGLKPFTTTRTSATCLAHDHKQFFAEIASIPRLACVDWFIDDLKAVVAVTVDMDKFQPNETRG